MAPSHGTIALGTRFNVLGAAFDFGQGGRECLLIDREQFPGHSVLGRHDRAEPQRQHRHLDHGRVQDLRVRPQILWRPQPLVRSTSLTRPARFPCRTS
jgi:hypothetical protein